MQKSSCFFSPNCATLLGSQKLTIKTEMKPLMIFTSHFNRTIDKNHQNLAINGGMI